MIGINKRRAHVPLWSFQSVKDALRRLQNGVDDAEHCGRTYLSSPDWHFRLFDRPADVQAVFSRPEFDASSWDQVEIPPLPTLAPSSRPSAWFTGSPRGILVGSLDRQR